MATAKRIYLVTRLVKDGAAEGTKPEYRLVNATSHQAAVRHVTRELYETEVATPYKVAEIAASGVRLEEAGSDE